MNLPDKFKGYGWLTPRDKILPCTTYGHWEVLFSSDEFIKISGIQKKIDELKDIEEGCASCKNRTDAEWHVYETASDNFRDFAYTKLYNHGWIRIGKAGYSLEFEGKLKELSYKKDTLQSIVDEFSIIENEEFGLILTGVK